MDGTPVGFSPQYKHAITLPIADGYTSDDLIPFEKYLIEILAYSIGISHYCIDALAINMYGDSQVQLTYTLQTSDKKLELLKKDNFVSLFRGHLEENKELYSILCAPYTVDETSSRSGSEVHQFFDEEEQPKERKRVRLRVKKDTGRLYRKGCFRPTFGSGGSLLKPKQKGLNFALEITHVGDNQSDFQEIRGQIMNNLMTVHQEHYLQNLNQDETGRKDKNGIHD
eukprot:UN28133